jgi:hypothetical protein
MLPPLEDILESQTSLTMPIQLFSFQSSSVLILYKLPPLEDFNLTFTLFNNDNSIFFHLTISGLSRKNICITPEEKIQDNSKKQVEILIKK